MKILEVLAHMDDRRALRARSARRWQPSGWTYVQITWMRKSEPRLQEFGRWPAATVLGVSSCTSSNAHTKPAPNVRATSANARSSERTHKRRTHFNQMSLREFFYVICILIFFYDVRFILKPLHLHSLHRWCCCLCVRLCATISLNLTALPRHLATLFEIALTLIIASTLRIDVFLQWLYKSSLTSH